MQTVCNKNLRILIVDDTSKNIQVVASTLKEDGYQMAFAQSGKTAIEKTLANKFDLILLDIMMPEMNGFEVCEQLKKNSRTKDIPVMFFTAKADIESIVRGFELGGVDYLTKPFNRKELLARVRTHLSLKHYREALELSNRKLKKANAELLEYQKELERAARTDSLTKLSNRRDMVEKIETEKIRADRNQKPFSIVLGDIDNFKLFNDEYGHDCGDFVLVSVAERMSVRIRKQDTAARWGGEEFLLLLPETDLEGGSFLAESLRAEIADSDYHYKNNSFKITMTFGVSSFSQAEDIEQCIKMADNALYTGKRLGKNRVILSESE